MTAQERQKCGAERSTALMWEVKAGITGESGGFSLGISKAACLPRRSL